MINAQSTSSGDACPAPAMIGPYLDDAGDDWGFGEEDEEEEELGKKKPKPNFNLVHISSFNIFKLGMISSLNFPI